MLVTLSVAALTFSACTAARWYLNRSSRREEDFFGGRVRLTELWNDAGPFGLPVGRRLWMALAASALGEILRLSRWNPAAGGLIFGGGASNLWENFRHGRAYDYLEFPKVPRLNRYVCNLADVAILFGGIGIIVGAARRGMRK